MHFLWGWSLMSTTTRRWLARASFALMFAAAALLLAAAGWRSLALVAFAVAGVCAVLAGGYWFLASRGMLRWVALALAVAVPVLILVVFARASLLWVAIVAVALMVAAAGTARAALSTGGQDTAMPAVPAARPQRPFLIMNPRSGGGKVTRFGLKDKAQALGAEVALLEGPGMVDVAALARKAVDGGADLLGVAGGDGTQALVAGIAAEHHLPFLVISAGTRNHFALDLGLDRDDPATCLDGLTDGEELRVDLGVIADRTFVNNASFGAYAEVVRSPAYRDDKRGTTLQMLWMPALSAWSPSRWTAPGRPSGSCAAGTARDSPSAPPGRSPSTPTPPRSRSASTARRSCCPPRSGAPSGPGCFAWSCPGNVPAFPLPRRPWNGRGCGSSPLSGPGQRPGPSPPSQARSEASKPGRTPWRGRPLPGTQPRGAQRGFCGISPEIMWTACSASSHSS
jgi:hypothetical protein